MFVLGAPDEVRLVQSLRSSQIAVQRGKAVVSEGQSRTPLYTLYSGWAFRFKTLSDGRRQILNFLLPGDFIGLQQNMSDDAAHGVEALSDVVLCVFPRKVLPQMYRGAPQLSHAITWLSAQSVSLVDDNLLSVGRRSAEERIASFLVQTFKRAAALMPDAGAAGVPFPVTQQHIADALGLSLVHTNKTLSKLARRGLHRIEDGRLFLIDADRLARVGDLYGDGKPTPRPLI